MAGDTRKELAAIGSKASEEANVQAGIRTVRDEIRATLNKLGVSEAISFDLVLKNGQNTVIASAANPALNTPMSEVTSVKPRQSATAGQGVRLADLG